jgi:hypothetical protein
MSKYNYNKDYFNKIDNADKAYWLGFLYADGCITRFYKGDILRSMSLEIGLCSEDVEHLRKFNKSLESNIPIQNRMVSCKGKKYSSNRLVVNNTKLCYDLIALGCTPQKTFTLRFPTEEIVPKQFMRDFIRGFFDGDGCICTTLMCGSPHIIVKISGVYSILNEICDYLVLHKILRKRPSIINKKNSNGYDIAIYGEDTIKEFLDYLYKDSHLYLDRKYQKYKDYYKDYNPAKKRGVHWDKRRQAYIIMISVNHNSIYLGGKKDLDEAIQIRKKAELVREEIEEEIRNGREITLEEIKKRLRPLNQK